MDTHIKEKKDYQNRRKYRRKLYSTTTHTIAVLSMGKMELNEKNCINCTSHTYNIGLPQKHEQHGTNKTQICAKPWQHQIEICTNTTNS